LSDQISAPIAIIQGNENEKKKTISGKWFDVSAIFSPTVPQGQERSFLFA
jgi:hypothetical protein